MVNRAPPRLAAPHGLGQALLELKAGHGLLAADALLAYGA